MATTQVTNTTYAGEKSAPYISAALLSANTIENGGLTVKQNIKYKQVVKTLAVGAGLIQDMDCDFTANSSVTLDERILEPKPFKVNLELCKEDYRSDWDAISMGYSAHDQLPPSFEDYLLAEVAANVATDMEKFLWQGDSAAGNQFDGFIKLFEDDADVIDVAGQAGGITAANVIDELGKVVDAIPEAIYGKEDLAMYVPQNVHRAYIRALGGFQSGGQGANGLNAQGTMWASGMGQPLMFDGVRIFVANGLPSSTIVAAQRSNLWFGCGLLRDENEVKVIDRSAIEGDDNVRIIMKFTSAVQYAFGGEVVLYKAS